MPKVAADGHCMAPASPRHSVVHSDPVIDGVVVHVEADPVDTAVAEVEKRKEDRVAGHSGDAQLLVVVRAAQGGDAHVQTVGAVEGQVEMIQQSRLQGVVLVDANVVGAENLFLAAVGDGLGKVWRASKTIVNPVRVRAGKVILDTQVVVHLD